MSLKSWSNTGEVIYGNYLNGNFNGLAAGTEITDGSLTWSKLASPVWTTRTPTLSNVTIGNGVSTQKYIQIGKIVHVAGYLTFGSTTSSSGVISIDLPVAAVNTTIPGKGSGFSLDSSAGVFYLLVVTLTSTTTISFYNNAVTQAVAGNYSTPFTLAQSDQIQYEFTYEAAV